MLKKILLAAVLAAASFLSYAQPYYPSAGGTITAGTTEVSTCSANSVLYVNASKIVTCAGKYGTSDTAGAGLTIAAGTATTDVNALNISQTWNAAGVTFEGVDVTITDTASAAGSLAFRVRGGASGTTNLISVDKTGQVLVPQTINGYAFNGATTSGMRYTASGISLDFGGTEIGRLSGTQFIAFKDLVAYTGTVLTGSTLKPLISGTAPTLASGGCTSAAMVANNGTASFTAGVGTGCSGSQPLVFTLPAATRGWNCYARNETNAATSVAAQSSAASTTSVTITNYARTTGLAAAWTDADVITVSCLGG